MPYRMVIEGLEYEDAQGQPIPHTVTIAWDTTKGGKHAIDYLTTFDRTEVDANPCYTKSGSSLDTICDYTETAYAAGNVNKPGQTAPWGSGSFDTIGIPTDPTTVPGNTVPGSGGGMLPGRSQVPGVFTLIGPAGQTPNLTLAGPGYNWEGAGRYDGDSTRSIEINFTAQSDTVVLAWGGHIASRQDWGFFNSAVSIPGSPYHMRLLDLDGKGGNQDLQLAADAVIFPASVTIIKNAIPDSDYNFQFDTTGSDIPLRFDNAPHQFFLDDDADATLPNTQTFDQLVHFGVARTVTEATALGWSLTDISCTVSAGDGTSPGTWAGNEATRTLTFNAKEGDAFVCTFTNELQTGSINVKKYHDLDANGSKNGSDAFLSDWSFWLDATRTVSRTPAR